MFSSLDDTDELNDLEEERRVSEEALEAALVELYQNALQDIRAGELASAEGKLNQILAGTANPYICLIHLTLFNSTNMF